MVKLRQDKWLYSLSKIVRWEFKLYTDTIEHKWIFDSEVYLNFNFSTENGVPFSKHADRQNAKKQGKITS